MQLYRTKDILLVKEKLGHKHINNNLIYTYLLKFNDKEEYYSATADNVNEAAKLVEQGFDYVTDIDGVKLFRKRKQSLLPFFFCSESATGLYKVRVRCFLLQATSISRVAIMNSGRTRNVGNSGITY
jgi:hypothetical protein